MAPELSLFCALDREGTLLLCNDVRHVAALATFIYRLRCAIAAMSSALERFDVLTFTAGVGENSARVRTETCRGLRYLGVDLDEHRNVTVDGDADISAAGTLSLPSVEAETIVSRRPSPPLRPRSFTKEHVCCIPAAYLIVDEVEKGGGQ